VKPSQGMVYLSNNGHVTLPNLGGDISGHVGSKRRGSERIQGEYISIILYCKHNE